MFKKIFTLAVVGLLMQGLCAQAAYAASKEEKETKRVERVKAGITRVGVGTDARVALKLQDKKLVGYISEANEDSFVVTDMNTRAATTVTYRDVTQIKGHNLGTGAKIAIGIGIGVGATLLFLFLYVAAHED